MPVVQCTCGARYRVPDSSAGKRAKCKKCGEVFCVPAAEPDIVPFADLEGLVSGQPMDVPRPPPAAAPREPAAPPRVAPPAAVAAPAVAYAVDPSTVAGESMPKILVAYLRSVARSVTILGNVGNLVTFLIVWFLLAIKAVVGLAGCLGLIASLVISGWYLAFQLNVVHNASGGEDELPELSFTGGWVDDVIIPLLKMLAVNVIAFLPAVIYVAYLALSGGDGAGAAVVNGVSLVLGNYGGAVDEVVIEAIYIALLVAAGLFLWPMLVLVVAVGSFGALSRIDLMLATIVRAFPGYFVAVLLVWATTVLQLGLNLLTQERVEPSLTTTILYHVGFAGLELFCAIIAMRAIGLFYHHFKSRFAWDWG